MTHRGRIEDYLKRSGGIITADYCREHAIPTVYLSRLVEEGVLRRVSPGLYLTEHGDHDTFFFFQYRYKKSVFSHETALYLLSVTDRIVSTMDVTVDTKYKFNSPVPTVRVHRVPSSWLTHGVTKAQTMFGNTVNVTSYERVLCDFVLNREGQEAEVYVQAIQRYVAYPNRQPQELFNIARKMGIADQVSSVMELVL